MDLSWQTWGFSLRKFLDSLSVNNNNFLFHRWWIFRQQKHQLRAPCLVFSTDMEIKTILNICFYTPFILTNGNRNSMLLCVQTGVWLCVFLHTFPSKFTVASQLFVPFLFCVVLTKSTTLWSWRQNAMCRNSPAASASNTVRARNTRSVESNRAVIDFDKSDKMTEVWYNDSTTWSQHISSPWQFKMIETKFLPLFSTILYTLSCYSASF